MEPVNHYSLESFTERHRADFDLHEPRPALWDALAQHLDEDAEAAGKSSLPRMCVAAGEPVPTRAAAIPEKMPDRQPVLRAQRRGRWQWMGIAVALAVLAVAAGLGEHWKAQHPIQVVANPGAARSAGPAALYLGADPGAVAASQGGPNGNARLDTAVHGMERYYASQLADRQTQLSQLAPEQVGEWTHDLVSLDSSYQRLKRELPQHPQPELVLTEMNRNLQTRLDILDRQLELRGDSQLAMAGGSSEYALADSRGMADNLPSRHAR